MKSLLIPKKDKRGVIVLILFFAVLMTILVVGFIAVMVMSIIDYGSDEITPIMTDLGVIEGTSTNLSEYGEYTFGKLDTVIQVFPWLVGFAYVAALIFTVIFAISVGSNPHPVFIGFYFALMILTIFGCIIMSNMYQDIYTGTDEMAIRLQEQTLMSYMILYSPLIIGIVTIVAGIFLFTKPSTTGGGFGI